ncbi:MAG: hypothetical protein AABZ30_09475 [Myxococcota bacterium]
MPEPSPGVEGTDWIVVKVKCQGCGKEIELRALPAKKQQRWACPHCHKRHTEIAELG